MALVEPSLYFSIYSILNAARDLKARRCIPDWQVISNALAEPKLKLLAVDRQAGNYQFANNPAQYCSTSNFRFGDNPTGTRNFEP
jgi:hypothetical protein